MVNNTTGSSITFVTSKFSCSILRFVLKDQKRKLTEVTGYSASQYMQYIVGALTDPGRFELDLLYDPDQVPPIAGAPAETVIFYFQAIDDIVMWQARMGIESHEVQGALENCLHSKCVLKALSGIVAKIVQITPFHKQVGDGGQNILNDDGALTYSEG